MILAESILYNATQLGIGIAIILAIIPAIDTVRGWFTPKAKPAKVPQPLETKEAVAYATKRELDDLKDRMDSLEQNISTSFRENSRAGEKRSIAIHERINGTSSAIGALQGEVHGLNESIKQMRDMLTQIIVMDRRSAQDLGLAMGAATQHRQS